MATGKFARSWTLTKQAWAVLKDDKRLLIFPLISGTLVMVVVGASIAGVVAAFMAADAAGGKHAADHAADTIRPWWYAGVFLLYLVTHFIMTFFQSALLACAMKKLDGGQAGVGYGLRAAVSRLPQIVGWSLISATVGMALQMLQDRVGWIGKLFLGAASIVWNIATFFVVPVLVIEGVGPITAVKRSAEVIKKTWGESLITQFGFSAVTTLLAVLVFLALAGLGIGLGVAMNSPWPGVVLIPLALLSVILIAVVQSAMKTLLVAATYRYAAQGVTSGPFDAETLQGVFRPKSR